jgi:hypothetical protein
MGSVNQNDETIIIKVSRDLKVMKAIVDLKEKKQEITPYRISRETEIPFARVQDSLKRIERYPLVLSFVREARRIGWEKQKLSLSASEAARERLEKAVKDGYYIGTVAPRGYVKTTQSGVSDLEPHSQEFPIVQQIIASYYRDGEAIEQIATKTKWPNQVIWTILFSNIRIYAGYVKGRGQWYPGRHKAAVNTQFWKNYIELRLQAPKPQYLKRGHCPTGFVRKFDEWIHDPALEAAVKKAWNMRLKGAGMTKIERETKLSDSTLAHMFVNPTYTNKIRVEGKLPQEWPDFGVEPYVSIEEWLKVQEIRGGRPGWLVRKENRQRIMMNRINSLVFYIMRQRPNTAQIRQKFDWKAKRTDYYLHILRENGIITKEGGKRGKFYTVEDFETKLESFMKRFE